MKELAKDYDMGLCIYVTGSYARHEASEYSDLDLFFVHESGRPISNIKKTLVDAEIIKLAQSLNFPEFSGDGRYLEIHSLEDILSMLGSPEDDYKNYFTARMLLLLESRYIYNESAYNKIIEKVIDSYYRDHHDHQDDFKPVFLVNDVVRFWKTMCLNYEHKRNNPDMDENTRLKAHLKNLKLKFSRMLTCYSMIAWLARNKATTPEDVAKAASLTPIERLNMVADEDLSCKEIVQKLEEAYAGFLETTGKNKSDVLSWIGSAKDRKAAFEKAHTFGDLMFELIFKVSKEEILRYVVI